MAFKLIKMKDKKQMLKNLKYSLEAILGFFLIGSVYQSINCQFDHICLGMAPWLNLVYYIFDNAFFALVYIAIALILIIKGIAGGILDNIK